MRIKSLFAFGLVSVLSACQSMPIKTADRSQGSGQSTVVSQDISEGSGAVDSAEVSNDEMSPPQMTNVQNRAGDGGVLIAYKFSGDRSMVPSGGCRLKLQNMTTSKTYFVSLKPTQMSAYKELPPGRYFGTRLSCKTTKIWNLDSLFADGFGVEAGKVSYVGKVMFEFDKGDLADFHHSSRAEGRNAFFTAQNTFVDDPKFISGFTKKPLTQEMVGTDTLEGFDVYAKGTNDPQGTLDPLMRKLNTCSKDVVKQDPLRFGDFKYIATYKDKKITNLDKEDDNHALSSDFMNCVENSMRAFHPNVAAGLEVQVRF